jgi:hypothetical protein
VQTSSLLYIVCVQQTAVLSTGKSRELFNIPQGRAYETICNMALLNFISAKNIPTPCIKKEQRNFVIQRIKNKDMANTEVNPLHFFNKWSLTY